MKIRSVGIVWLLLFGTSFLFSQVKIGENLQAIDPSSLLELESTQRALVLTRVSTAQMNTITPLHGALVYNTDTNCIYLYNGLVWRSLCDSDTQTNTLVQRAESIVIASNGQNQFTTPQNITDIHKIDVYRNGIKINFTAIGTNIIQLEPNVVCFDNDEIKIVQLL
jgi:hypothetical protein